MKRKLRYASLTCRHSNIIPATARPWPSALIDFTVCFKSSKLLYSTYLKPGVNGPKFF